MRCGRRTTLLQAPQPGTLQLRVLMVQQPIRVISSGQKMVVPFELMEPDVVDDSAPWPRHKEESYHPDIG